MRIQRYTKQDARRVLVGMVTDRIVCSRIAAQWTPEGLFSSRWENIVGGWCIRHLLKHGTPIGRHIESVFEEWSSRKKDDRMIDMMERFLTFLNDEYERESPLSSDYVLDLAGRHFNAVRLKNAIAAAEADLDLGQVEDATNRFTEFRRIELGVGSVTIPGRDFEAWVSAFDLEQNRSLIEFPKLLAEFVEDVFCRDAFVSFTGSYGRGKSFWLMEIAFRAVKAKRRVLMFEVGDMSRRQIMMRLGQRAARRPMKDCIVDYPVAFEKVSDGPIIEKRKLEAVDVRKAFQAWKKLDGFGRFHLSVHSSGSISAKQIRNHVEEGEREGWVPDVVVIDYADLLAPPKGISDKREGIDETWKQLRRLSQDLHCLVVTATQADAASYRANLIRGGNFSDSRTKNDHVTAGFGLNSNDQDRDQGVVRLNWLKRRDGACNENWQIAVAGCLAIGCPLIVCCR